MMMPCTEENLWDGNNPKEECYAEYTTPDGITDTATAAYIRMEDDSLMSEVICKTPPSDLNGVYQWDWGQLLNIGAGNEYVDGGGTWRSIDEILQNAMQGVPTDATFTTPLYSKMTTATDSGVATMGGSNIFGHSPEEAGVVCCALQDYITTASSSELLEAGYHGWNTFIESLIIKYENPENEGTPVDMSQHPVPSLHYQFEDKTLRNMLGDAYMVDATHNGIGYEPPQGNFAARQWGLWNDTLTRFKLPRFFGDAYEVSGFPWQSFNWSNCNFAVNSLEYQWCNYGMFRHQNADRDFPYSQYTRTDYFYPYMWSDSTNWDDSVTRWENQGQGSHTGGTDTPEECDDVDNWQCEYNICYVGMTSAEGNDAFLNGGSYFCPMMKVGNEWIRMKAAKETSNYMQVKITRDAYPRFPANKYFSKHESEAYAHGGYETVRAYHMVDTISFPNTQQIPALSHLDSSHFPNSKNYPTEQVMHVNRNSCTDPYNCSYVSIGQCRKATSEPAGLWSNRDYENMEFNYYDIIKWLQGFLKQDIQEIFDNTILNGSHPQLNTSEMFETIDSKPLLNPVINDVHKFLSVLGYNYFGLPHDTKYGHMLRPEFTMLKHQIVQVESTTGICKSFVDYECTESDINTCSDVMPNPDYYNTNENLGSQITVCADTEIPCSSDADCSNYGCDIAGVGEIVQIEDITNPMYAQDCPIIEQDAVCPYYTYTCDYADYWCHAPDGNIITDNDGNPLSLGCDADNVGSVCPEYPDDNAICQEHITSEPSSFCNNTDEDGNWISLPCGSDMEHGMTTQEQCCEEIGGGTLFD